MSGGIHQIPEVIRNLTNHDGKPTGSTSGETPELPVVPRHNEHGSVYFNLDWQNQRAADRQQRTQESFHGENFPTIQTGDGDESNFSNFRQSNSETIPFRQSDFNQNNFLAARHNSSNYANNRSAQNYSESNSANFNQNDESLFNALQNQPEKTRTRILQMSEPRLIEVEIDGRIEPRQVLRFDELVQRMESLNLTTREFAETLPLEERDAFLARFQTSQTSGGERPAQTADKLPVENKPLLNPENQSEKLFTPTTTQIKNAGNLTAQTVEENSSGAILQTPFGKTAETPKNILTAEKSFNAPLEANLKTANGAANIFGAENSAARILNNGKAENSSVANVLTRRETGEILGGALINGAFAAVGEHEQAERNRVGDSNARGNFYGADAAGFAAGATGSLLSAAIGRVIPGAGTDVSGVLGFISGVVVGVEVDQGFRWLGAAKNDFPAANNFQLNGDENFILNSNLLPGFA